MRQPANELFAPLAEYYPRRHDYISDESHGDALNAWAAGGDPVQYLEGMTPAAKARFPGDHPPPDPAPPATPTETKYQFDIWGGAVCAVLALILATPAFAQSDDALQAEMDRLMGHQIPQSKFRGYRGRVPASDYQLEFQMQQLDKQQKADDMTRYNQLLEEQSRRSGESYKGARQAERDRREASSQESSQRIRGYLETQQQQLAQDQQRVGQRQRARSQATQASTQRSRAQGMQQVEAMFQRTRAETARQAERAQYVAPIARGPVGPSFPIPQVDYNAHRHLPRDTRTPLEAFREGQQLGEAIGGMIRGIMDTGKRRRQDAIVQRFGDGTITGEDYRQLVKDGYTDLAHQLMQIETKTGR